MTVQLTPEMLAKMFRCPDCITDPPVVVEPSRAPNFQKITVLHAESCHAGPKRDYIDDAGARHIFINTSLVFMPYEIEDNDPVLRRLEGK